MPVHQPPSHLHPSCEAAYEVQPVCSIAHSQAYLNLLESTYSQLGFLSPQSSPILYPKRATRFALFHQGNMVGIFCLRPVGENNYPYTEFIPDLQYDSDKKLEINNFILTKAHRGSVGRILMLYHAVQYALANDYAFIVGIARYSALRFFVDAGAIPIYHPPLHLLGKTELRDFVMYFDLRRDEDVAYLHQRARRLIHQITILNALRRDFLKDRL